MALKTSKKFSGNFGMFVLKHYVKSSGFSSILNCNSEKAEYWLWTKKEAVMISKINE